MSSVWFTELPRPGLTPRARGLVAELFSRRPAVSGSVGKPEAELILSEIERLDARRLVEIGVASGACSFYMLAMLEALGGPRRLFGFDAEAAYFGDPSLLTGYVALDSQFAHRFSLSAPATSLDLAAKFSGDSEPVDFAFIDGNHKHPWPTLDFLFLLPQMREGGVIALHDINLAHIIGPSAGLGPRTLFAAPFADRFIPDVDIPNLGCIRISEREAMIDLAFIALREEWQAAPGRLLRRRILDQIEAGPLEARAGEMQRLLGL